MFNFTDTDAVAKVIRMILINVRQNFKGLLVSITVCAARPNITVKEYTLSRYTSFGRSSMTSIKVNRILIFL